MNFLKAERAVLDALLPGLDAELSRIALLDMEREGNPSLEVFRRMRGPGLVVPFEYGGLGASMLQAVRVQRAIGSRAPSLAVATTMHHFSAAAIVDASRIRTQPGLEAMLLGRIATENLYLASAFAEGKVGGDIFAPELRVERGVEGLRVTGTKKPCSLSTSMDILTTSLLVPSEDGGSPQFALAVIPANTPGIECRPFWESSILAGAESNEVILTDVFVPNMSIAYLGDPATLDQARIDGFLAFELLITATYLGIASSLIETVLRQVRGTADDRAAMSMELEASMAAIEGLAIQAETDENSQELVAKALFVRRSTQSSICRATDLAVEVLGGMSFIRDPATAYLLAASRALAFHPPTRGSSTAALDAYISGDELVLS